MLEDAGQNDFQDIVSWNSHGVAFKVHKPTEFSDKIMPTYFNQTKYKSFQRQLNLYGFTRIHQGLNKGNYSHKCFRRQDAPHSLLVRHKTSTTTTKNTAQANASASTQQARTHARHDGHSNRLSLSAFDMQALMNFEAEPISSGWDKEADTRVSGSFLEQGQGLPRLKGFFETDCIADNGPISDLISAHEKQSPYTASTEETYSSNNNAESTTGHSFPFMLHDMLGDAESNNFAHIVSWERDSMSYFKVHRQDEFVEKIMPLYFAQSQYGSFRRQLNHYSFTRVTRGSNKGRYFHTSFVKGARFLCKRIIRARAKRQEII
jgi:hypothetical protein